MQRAELRTIGRTGIATCNVRTLVSLEERGLVERAGGLRWRLTMAGSFYAHKRSRSEVARQREVAGLLPQTGPNPWWIHQWFVHGGADAFSDFKRSQVSQ